MKRALITGISGQDGSYLAEFLLAKDYEVHGIVRRASSPNRWRIGHILERLHLHDGDLLDGGSLTRIVRQVRPHEVYNLAAQSHVRASFDEPDHTGDVTGLGTLRLLEAVRQCGKDARFYQASSSEMFGSSPPPQNERTLFHPRSPYAVAKVFAHHSTVLYREAYGLHASCGILLNHESPRRGEDFVTRKITRAAARIKLGQQSKLYLGNLDAKRDWGFAGDYVEAMWLMLQQETPDDYVIATGETRSVREFLDAAFGFLGLDWKKYVEVDPAFFRPAEVDALQGDCTKARDVLRWAPKVSFVELVEMMVRADGERLGAK
jgi:GDPmannose 4,6-dehydratase